MQTNISKSCRFPEKYLRWSCCLCIWTWGFAGPRRVHTWRSLSRKLQRILDQIVLFSDPIGKFRTISHSLCVHVCDFYRLYGPGICSHEQRKYELNYINVTKNKCSKDFIALEISMLTYLLQEHTNCCQFHRSVHPSQIALQRQRVLHLINRLCHFHTPKYWMVLVRIPAAILNSPLLFNPVGLWRICFDSTNTPQWQPHRRYNIIVVQKREDILLKLVRTNSSASNGSFRSVCIFNCEMVNFVNIWFCPLCSKCMWVVLLAGIYESFFAKVFVVSKLCSVSMLESFSPV